MKLRAPAKVNLHLRVLGRREDGFHDLDTLMVPLSLADEVTIEKTEGGRIELTCDDPAVPTGDENLVVKAARLFDESLSVRIHLGKRIPMGAGLGGGSSDAAAVLVALNRIFDEKYSVGELEGLAAQIGSDIPFFVRCIPAQCGGRGEKMSPSTIAEKFPLLLIKPPFGVETAWAYKNWVSSPSLPGAGEEEQALGDLPIVNSLERPVFGKFLQLPVIKRWLLDQPETRVAAMSGSGSTMFAVLHESAAGAALERRAREEFGETFWTCLCETRAGR